MYKRRYCEKCDTIVNCSIKEKIEKDHLMGFNIEYIAKYLCCDTCNE